MQRTATPWIVHETDGGAVYISDNHDFSRATFAIRANGEQERAAFIVRAVNAHEALTAALNDLINDHGHFINCSRSSNPNIDERYCNLNCRQIRAALKLAEA